MTDMMTAAGAITLDEAMAFIWYEADLLDNAEYDEWLALWTADAHYIVPIEPGAADFENTLNYAYDDHSMRQKRVDRLRNGQSISTSPVARTVRVQSRFRLLQSARDACKLRCAQILTEFRRSRERNYTADVEFDLMRGEDSKLKISRKVVRLINSTDALTGIGYIL
jgi:3-phenylpropionate/cinnamic acid dioxygenase small subunit